MRKNLLSTILAIIICTTFFSTTLSASPDIEFKELTVTQVINKYLSDRELDSIEGLWIYNGIKGPILLAVLSGAIPDIDEQYGNKKGFVGIHLQPEAPWDKGEKRFSINKILDPYKNYKGSWQGTTTVYVYGFPVRTKTNIGSTFAVDGNTMHVDSQVGAFELQRYFPSRNPGPGIAGTGSGFFISPNLVVTNHHVVDSAKKVEIRTKDGKWVPAKVLIFDEDYDTAILEVIGLEKEVKPIPIGDLSHAKVGQRVYSFGFPTPNQLSADISSMQLRMNEGIVTSLQGYKGSDQEFQHSIPSTGGNSGGPMMNAYGEVLGIVSSGLTPYFRGDLSIIAPQNINFAKRIRRAVELVEQIERSRELSYQDKGQTEIKPEVMAEQAQSSTVLVRVEGYRRAKAASSNSLLNLSK